MHLVVLAGGALLAGCTSTTGPGAGGSGGDGGGSDAPVIDVTGRWRFSTEMSPFSAWWDLELQMSSDGSISGYSPRGEIHDLTVVQPRADGRPVSGALKGSRITLRFDAYDSGATDYVGEITQSGEMAGYASAVSDWEAERMPSPPAAPASLAVQYFSPEPGRISARVTWEDRSEVETCFLIQLTSKPDPNAVFFPEDLTCHNISANEFNATRDAESYVITGFEIARGDLVHYRIRAIRDDTGKFGILASPWVGWVSVQVP